MMKSQLNLLPPQKSREQERKRAFYCRLLSVMVLSLTLEGYFASRSMPMLTHQLRMQQELRGAIREVTCQLQEIEPLKAQKVQLSEPLNHFKRASQSRFHVLELFEQIFSQMPEGIQLTLCARAGSRLVLSGLANEPAEVAHWLRQLSESPSVLTPQLKNLQARAEPNYGVEFTLEATLTGVV